MYVVLLSTVCIWNKNCQFNQSWGCWERAGTLCLEAVLAINAMEKSHQLLSIRSQVVFIKLNCCRLCSPLGWLSGLFWKLWCLSPDLHHHLSITFPFLFWLVCFVFNLKRLFPVSLLIRIDISKFLQCFSVNAAPALISWNYCSVSFVSAVSVIFKHHWVLASLFFQSKLLTSNIPLTDLRIAADLVLTDMNAKFEGLQALLLARKLKQSVVLWSAWNRMSCWVRCHLHNTLPHTSLPGMKARVVKTLICETHTCRLIYLLLSWFLLGKFYYHAIWLNLLYYHRHCVPNSPLISL